MVEIIWHGNACFYQTSPRGPLQRMRKIYKNNVWPELIEAEALSYFVHDVLLSHYAVYL